MKFIKAEIDVKIKEKLNTRNIKKIEAKISLVKKLTLYILE